MRRVLLLLLLLACGAGPAQAGQYSRDLFARALENRSTAPDYVLITVVDPEKHTKRAVCTTANLFLGALHREYFIGYDELGRKRVKEIALGQPNREFTFKDPKAEKNLADYSTPEVLAEVRRLFAAKTDSELLDQELIDSLTVVRRDLPHNEASARHDAYRDAVAHALLERGIGCTMGDYTDRLTAHK